MLVPPKKESSFGLNCPHSPSSREWVLLPPLPSRSTDLQILFLRTREFLWLRETMIIFLFSGREASTARYSTDWLTKRDHRHHRHHHHYNNNNHYTLFFTLFFIFFFLNSCCVWWFLSFLRKWFGSKRCLRLKHAILPWKRTGIKRTRWWRKESNTGINS